MREGRKRKTETERGKRDRKELESETEEKGESKAEKQKRETELKEKRERRRQKLPGRKAKGERERGPAGLVRILVPELPELPLADNFAIFPSGTDHHSPTAPDFRALYPR